MKRWMLAAAVVTVSAAHAAPKPGSFGDDLAFLKQHQKVVVLSDATGQAQVAVAPGWQGRVLTSTATGAAGLSYGWINRELIAARKVQRHINVFGGEDRFWLGPEGGQYSIFFAKGVPFDLAHWFTPAPIDTHAFRVVRQGRDRVALHHAFVLTNYSGTKFNVAVDRTVRLLPNAAVWKQLGVVPRSNVKLVAFESSNRITNAGRQAWKKDTGLLSVWILGMFKPSPATTVVIPIQAGPEDKLGKTVNDAYFGKVPDSRIKLTDNAVYFSADGGYRSKIGVGPRRCKGMLGSYDAAHSVLTLVQFTFPPGRTDYVNSMWELQKQPYGGDVANSYNDGPPSPGAKPLGPFYELESSSPAAALAPGASLEHVHRTMHLQGPSAALDAITHAMLGVGLKDITTALPSRSAKVN